LKPWPALFARLVALGLMVAAPGQAQRPLQAAPPVYAFDVEARVVPTERAVRVQLRLGENASAVEWMRFRIDPERHRNFQGDGEILISEGHVEWHPPSSGGALRYDFAIDHLRDERSYDARCANRWAIFRGGDMVPPAHVRTAPGARSRTRLHLSLPEGWSAALPYAKRPNGYYSVQHAERRFDRPTGWMVLGHIGVRRDTIDGMRVSIAGPAGHSLRRLDLLAFLRWQLPLVRGLIGDLPDRLLVVGAGDPMWRGGLSGPNSLFLHAERPFITEDGSSPLLHELIHSLGRNRPGEGGDWISEGFAEVYSVEMLRRSGAVSRERYQATRAAIVSRAAKGGDLRARSVYGDTTAKAADVLWQLDAVIAADTAGEKSLDDLFRAVAQDSEKFTTERLQTLAEGLTGSSLQGFFERHVPVQSP
jgi:hypothetical protein